MEMLRHVNNVRLTVFWLEMSVLNVLQLKVVLCVELEKKLVLVILVVWKDCSVVNVLMVVLKSVFNVILGIISVLISKLAVIKALMAVFLVKKTQKSVKFAIKTITKQCLATAVRTLLIITAKDVNLTLLSVMIV